MNRVQSLLYLILRLLHVSASMCHLQGTSYVLLSYLKAEFLCCLLCTVSAGGLSALVVVVPWMSKHVGV
jgi:hypothetical protein